MTAKGSGAARHIVATVAVGLTIAGAARPEEVMDVVEVVGQTPLGASIDVNRLASNVQTASAEEIREQRALDLAEFMQRRLGGVFINEAQGNPLQPDLQYRGFVGSPLLGLPQGIAVYQDGVRVNEPFGDTVNWALIPESAVDSLYLMPGSNPLFGLNALGGSIVINTKDGFSNPGTRAEVYGGSFSRFGLQAETGGLAGNRIGYFVTGAYTSEDGWRDYSPTEALQFFTSLGWRATATTAQLTATVTKTDLIGNGPAPIQLLKSDRRAIYTRPDQTENDLAMVNFSASHDLSAAWSLTGNAYLRHSDIATMNGDDSDADECLDTPGFLCSEGRAGETVILDIGGDPIPAREELIGAVVGRSNTRQDGSGFGIQASWSGDIGGRSSLLVLGASYDQADVRFDSSAELGRLDDTRRAIPGGYFDGDGVTRLTTRSDTLGIYISQALQWSDRLSLNVAGRYNDTNVSLRDGLGTALDGKHQFKRLNPSIGLTFILAEALTFYAAYSESSRVPSPVELTCADEDDPCRLPNAFLADPPLEPVIAATYEAGIRGEWANGNWHGGWFRTDNEDDILFISAGALTNEGYFDNVGRTRRSGLEINIEGHVFDRIDWFLAYTYLDATFQENLTLPSAHNPSAIDGEVAVQRGDRLPLTPRHLFKTGANVAIGDRITIGGELLAASGFYLRGDEGSDNLPVGEYVVLNLRGDWRLNDNVSLFLNIDNVADAEYETFGLFGEANELLGEEYDDARFLSPAAPTAAWLGLSLKF